jgi:hypothetical protein
MRYMLPMVITLHHLSPLLALSPVITSWARIMPDEESADAKCKIEVVYPTMRPVLMRPWEA